MRWLAAAILTLFAACGGQSRSHPGEELPEPDAGGTGVAGAGGGTAGSAGTAGVNAGGAGVVTAGGGGDTTGTAGADDGGTGYVPPSPTDPKTSAECVKYEGTDDLLAACGQLGRPCPADYATALASFTDDIPGLTQYVRTGCGLTSLIDTGGLGGDVWTFDASGNLVGYSRSSDAPWGPCEDFSYDRGTSYAACENYRDCALAPDGTLDAPCLCACPDPPPEGGVADVPNACVYDPSFLGLKCHAHLSDWMVVGAGGDGTIRKGCGGFVEFAWAIYDDVLICVYDQNERFVGSERRVTTDACTGVTTWRYGATYPACDDDQWCKFGTDASASPACTNYPFF